MEYKFLCFLKQCFYKGVSGNGFCVRNKYVIFGVKDLVCGWCILFIDVCYSSFVLFMLWYIFDREDRFMGQGIRLNIGRLLFDGNFCLFLNELLLVVVVLEFVFIEFN